MHFHWLLLSLAALQSVSAFNLEPGVEISGSYSVDQVLSLDFDHDGLNDLVLLDQNRNILRVILRVSERGFAEEPVHAQPFAPGANIHQADLNNDGFDDLIIHEDSVVRCLLSNPTGFSPLPEFNIGSNRLDLKAVHDFDHDGEIDLAFFPASYDQAKAINFQTPRIYWGASEGKFETAPLFLGPENHKDSPAMIHLQNLQEGEAGFLVSFDRGRSIVTLTDDRQFKVDWFEAGTGAFIDVNGDGLVDGIAITGSAIEGKFVYDLQIRTRLEGGDSSEVEIASFEVDHNGFDHIGWDFIKGADLDGDGDQDLIVTGQYSTEFLPVINQGADGWESSLPVEMGQRAGELQIIDLNQDGKSDVIAQHYGHLIVDALGEIKQYPGFATESVVYWSETLRQFSESSPLGKTQRPLRPQFVDQDNDGYKDLVFGDLTKGRIVRVQGDVAPMRFHESLIGIAQGRRLLDFDLRTAPGMTSPSLLTISMNDQWGGFSFSAPKPLWLQLNPVSRNKMNIEDSSVIDSSNSPFLISDSFVRTANIDGDDNLDFVTINPRNRDLVWYEQDGWFWSTPRAIGRVELQTTNFDTPAYDRVVIGDCDGDGLDEIIISGQDRSVGVRVFRYRPEEDKFEQSSVSSGYEIIMMKLGDLEGDGDLDLISLSGGFGTAGQLLINENIDGEFAAPIVIPTDLQVRAFAIGDLGDDGLAEIVTGGGLSGDALGNFSTSQDISFLRQLEPFVFGERIKIADGLSPCSEILLTDMNRDGRLDVVSSSRLGASIEVFLNQETPPVADLDEWLAIHGEATSDPDGDGRNNLIEFYFGSDPGVRDDGPEFKFSQRGAGIFNRVDSIFTTNRRRDLDPREWTLVIEGSQDLISWDEPSDESRTVSRNFMDSELELVEETFYWNREFRYFRWRLAYNPIAAD